MFDLLLESCHRDDSKKRSNIEFGQEIMELASIEVYFTHVIWGSVYLSVKCEQCRLESEDLGLHYYHVAFRFEANLENWAHHNVQPLYIKSLLSAIIS